MSRKVHFAAGLKCRSQVTGHRPQVTGQVTGYRLQVTGYRTYRKIPKISPSTYKPPKPVTQKPSVKSPPRGSYLENYLQIQSKTKPKR